LTPGKSCPAARRWPWQPVARNAITIHFGSVDQGHALGNAGLQSAELGCLISSSHAHLPGSKAQGRDFFTTSKLNVFHRFQTLERPSPWTTYSNWTSIYLEKGNGEQ
jgi:hypothetical protein